MLKFIRCSLLLVVTIFLSACGSSPQKEDNRSQQAMYTDAREELDAGAFEEATKRYDALIARYPYGSYALQSELDIAYAHYLQRETGLAAAAADRFIRSHPNHPNVDYAYYIKAMAAYGNNSGLLSFMQNKDLSERDPEANLLAFNTFKELVQRFPESRYLSDSRQRMAQLLAALANHELNAARYYMKRRAPIAAINRAQSVIEKFPDADQVEDALGIMIEAYGQLGLPALQESSRKVLQANFPRSRFLASK